jgi:hypothetical protein
MTWTTWQKYFGGVAPAGYLLRQHVPERWLRVHSLPGSKRYPSSSSEEDALLARQNEVAVDLLGDDSPAILFVRLAVSIEEFDGKLRVHSWANRVVPATIRTIILDDSDDEALPVSIGASKIRWEPGAWDDLLLDVAHWRIGSICFLNPKTGEVFAPYDGGVDLILNSSLRVELLSEKWRAWLSEHHTGL